MFYFHVFILDLAYNLGVGFYSTYLIADKVIVTSKHKDHDQYIWESQPGASFIVNNDINAQQPSRGTNITLFLKDNQVHKVTYLYFFYYFFCLLNSCFTVRILGRGHYQESRYQILPTHLPPHLPME